MATSQVVVKGERNQKQPNTEIAKADSNGFSTGQSVMQMSTDRAAGNGILKSQAAALSSSSLPIAQRQALAVQIGMQQGNQHLQRILSSGDGRKNTLPYQPETVAGLRSPQLLDMTGQLVIQRDDDGINTTDPVVLIEIDAGAGRAVLHQASGATIEGTGTTDLAPGSYEVKVGKKTKRWWFAQGVVKAGERFDIDLGNKGDPWMLKYSEPVQVKIVSTAAPEPIMSVDERLQSIKDQLEGWTGSSAEEKIVQLLSEVPAEQAAEMVRRLEAEQFGDENLLAALDDNLHGDNNLRLHEALSLLRIKAMGDKVGAEGLAKAPVLPWHDVMGFFEDNATFSVTETKNGNIRIEYLGGTRLLNSKDFGDEVKNLPFDIFVGGVEYKPDQVLVIHDYDSGRFVPLVAQQLIGYQHAGVRKFLGDVATVASLATPLSAARTVAGKVAVVALERVLPATLLLIDENRLNIVKWFPNWGPKMLHFADLVKVGVAAYGIARFAVSGYEIFRDWRAVVKARRALDGSAPNSKAASVAASLEKQADDLIAKADEIYKSESTAKAAEAVSTPTMPEGTPSPPKMAEPTPSAPPAGAKPPPSIPTPEPAAKPAKIFEGITSETKEMLAKRPDLKRALETYPRAAKAMKLCKSSCWPEFATPDQIARVESLIADAERSGAPLNIRRMSEFLHAQKNADELGIAIGVLESHLAERIAKAGGVKAAEVAEEFAEAADKVPDPTVPDIPPSATTLRRSPGVASGGKEIPEISGPWFPINPKTNLPARTGPFPGQIAEKMRGMHFNTFDEFRQMFWKMVAEDPALRSGWTKKNLALMKKGYAPVAPGSEHLGGGAPSSFKWNIEHKHAIKNGGDVYDMDNMAISTPAFHEAVGD